MEDVSIFYEYLVYLRPFDIFYGHLVYFVVIWYFFPVLVYCIKEHLETVGMCEVFESAQRIKLCVLLDS
jgi:hypothetical protein